MLTTIQMRSIVREFQSYASVQIDVTPHNTIQCHIPAYDGSDDIVTVVDFAYIGDGQWETYWESI